MKRQPAEWTWLDARETVTAAELARLCGLSSAELDELVEYGALAPLPAAQSQRVFSAECVMSLRTAGKMRVDFDLDLFTVAIVLDYLGRIEILERELKSLQAHMPGSAVGHRDGPQPWHEPHS